MARISPYRLVHARLERHRRLAQHQRPDAQCAEAPEQVVEGGLEVRRVARAEDLLGQPQVVKASESM